MKLKDYKMTFITIGLIGVLLIAAYTLVGFFQFPMGESFSEIYILGSNHMFENYPFNVAAGPVYSVYVDVGNHMTTSNYYMVHVKFRNATGLLPNYTSGTPSPIPTLYVYTFFLQKNTFWESSLNFSISESNIIGNQSTIKRLNINDVVCDVNLSSMWDSEKNGHYYQLFLELWVYDVQSNSAKYDNRFVSLQLNFTESASSSFT